MIFSALVSCKLIFFYANSEDPYEMPHYSASHLGLNCLSMSNLKDARLINDLSFHQHKGYTEMASRFKVSSERAKEQRIITATPGLVVANRREVALATENISLSNNKSCHQTGQFAWKAVCAKVNYLGGGGGHCGGRRVQRSLDHERGQDIAHLYLSCQV